MKKLLLLSAVLIGAATASQAGVHFSFGLPLPPLPLPRVVIGGPSYYAPAPVYREEVAPPVVYSAPSVVVEPPVVSFGYGGGYYGPSYGYYGRPYYGRPYYGGHYYGREYGHYYGHRR